MSDVQAKVRASNQAQQALNPFGTRATPSRHSVPSVCTRLLNYATSVLQEGGVQVMESTSIWAVEGVELVGAPAQLPPTARSRMAYMGWL